MVNNVIVYCTHLKNVRQLRYSFGCEAGGYSSHQNPLWQSCDTGRINACMLPKAEVIDHLVG